MVSGSGGRDAAARAGWKPAATTPGDAAQSFSFEEEQSSYSSGEDEREGRRFGDGDGAAGIAAVRVVRSRAEAGEEEAVGEGALDVEDVGWDGEREAVGVQGVRDTSANGAPAAAVGVGFVGRAVVANDEPVAILDFAAADERGVRARGIKNGNIGAGGDIELESVGLAAVMIQRKEVGRATELESEVNPSKTIDVTDIAGFQRKCALGGRLRGNKYQKEEERHERRLLGCDVAVIGWKPPVLRANFAVPAYYRG